MAVFYQDLPGLVPQPPPQLRVLLNRVGNSADPAFLRRSIQMNMPKAISTWCMVVFFLLVGLTDLLGIGIPPVLTGIVALAAAVFLFLGR